MLSFFVELDKHDVYLYLVPTFMLIDQGNSIHAIVLARKGLEALFYVLFCSATIFFLTI
jgi:hypothetical protein